jgi:hypothetical protein
VGEIVHRLLLRGAVVHYIAIGTLRAATQAACGRALGTIAADGIFAVSPYLGPRLQSACGGFRKPRVKLPTRGALLERSLSVLLPVHNAQATLEDCVARILDVLPELTRRFDLLIIDDGSSDHTVEVAHDLARRYPQVRLARHSQRRGLGQAIRTGLAQTDGEMVFVHDTHPDMEPADLPKLWQQGFDREVLLARRLATPRGRHRDAWLMRLFAFAASSGPAPLAERHSGFHMFPRESLEELRDAAIAASQAPAVSKKLTRADRPIDPASSLARPNFLGRLKRFALEE